MSELLDKNSEQKDLFGEIAPFKRQRKATDLLNLMEIPMALLSQRRPEGVNTLVYSAWLFDKTKDKKILAELTLTGTETHGLTTAFDEDVLLALIQITLKNGVSSKKVEYEDNEIIRMLGLPRKGDSYRRISESIVRWGGVHVQNKNGWWHGEDEGLGSKNFHFIQEDGAIPDSRTGKMRKYFVWSDLFYEELLTKRKVGFIWDDYTELKSPIAKRLSRILKKNFSWTNRLDYNLRELMCDRFGMWTDVPIAKLKEKLKPAVLELEGLNYIKSMDYKKRFSKQTVGEWYVTFEKPSFRSLSNKDKSLDIEVEEVSQIHQKLREIGILEKMIPRLLAAHEQDFIEAQIEILEAILCKPNHGIENPGGFFVNSLKPRRDEEGIQVSGIIPPKGFKTQVEIEFEQEQQEKVKVAKEERARQKRIDEAKLQLQILLSGARRELSTKLAAEMDESTEKSLIEFINAKNTNGELSDAANYDLRAKNIEPLKGDVAFAGTMLEGDRHAFFEQRDPQAFTVLGYRDVAGDTESGRLEPFSAKIIEAAVEQLEADPSWKPES